MSKTTKHTMKNEAEDVATFDRTSWQLALRLRDAIEARLKEHDDGQRLSAAEISALSSALVELQQIVRMVHHVPAENQSQDSPVDDAHEDPVRDKLTH